MIGGRGIGFGGLLVAAILVSGPGAARASEVAEAVLLLPSVPSEPEVAARLLAVAREQLRPAWRVVPAAGLVEFARTDPACTGAEAARIVADVLVGIRDGQRLFYDDTAIDRAQETLAGAVNRYLEHPCSFGTLASERLEVCAGAVLLARLLIAPRPEAAAALARRIAHAFPAEAVLAVDVPPEAARFLAGIRADVESVRAELTVAATPAPDAAGAVLVVDGRVFRSEPPWAVPVAAGAHEVAILLRSGAAVSRRVVTGDAPAWVDFDLVLGGALGPGPEGSLVLSGVRAHPEDGPAIARRVAEVTGRTVLLVRGGADDGVRVTPFDRSGEQAEVLALRPLAEPPGAVDVTIPEEAPILERPSWPWPWVSAGAAAALLGVGIGLNVAANRAAAAINDGENRLSAWRGLHAASITCYALSGAGAAAAVLLLVLHPSPQTHLVIGPDQIQLGTVF